jgi:hypothetical protein
MTSTAPTVTIAPLIATVDAELCPRCQEPDAAHWVGTRINVDYWDCFACTYEWTITVGT